MVVPHIRTFFLWRKKRVKYGPEKVLSSMTVPWRGTSYTYLCHESDVSILVENFSFLVSRFKFLSFLSPFQGSTLSRSCLVVLLYSMSSIGPKHEACRWRVSCWLTKDKLKKCGNYVHDAQLTTHTRSYVFLGVIIVKSIIETSIRDAAKSCALLDHCRFVSHCTDNRSRDWIHVMWEWKEEKTPSLSPRSRSYK